VLLSSMTATGMIIALPRIFRGINLNPLVPANSSYLLWATCWCRPSPW
jgi:hypothetical protein